MKSAPVRIFNALGYVCSAEPGEVHATSLAADGSYDGGIYFYFHGSCTPSILETGEVLSVRFPGWLNTEHQSRAQMLGGKTLLANFPIGAKWVCIQHNINAGRPLPNCSSLVLSAGQSYTAEQDTSLFFCYGASEVVGGNAIRLATNVKLVSGQTILASKDSYFLKEE